MSFLVVQCRQLFSWSSFGLAGSSLRVFISPVIFTCFCLVSYEKSRKFLYTLRPGSATVNSSRNQSTFIKTKKVSSVHMIN